MSSILNIKEKGRNKEKEAAEGTKKKIIFFDTETNGVSACSSVLSISAIKCIFDGAYIDVEEQFTRYYFRKPGETQNPEAIKVNGLTDGIILQKRGDAQYARHFFQDMPNFHAFCADAQHFVGHNIAFDQQFIAFPLAYTFCTMRENTKILQLKRRDGKTKWPRLSETASYYRIALQQEQLHDSAYDTLLTYEIFKKMLYEPKTRKRILAFLTQ